MVKLAVLVKALAEKDSEIPPIAPPPFGNDSWNSDVDIRLPPCFSLRGASRGERKLYGSGSPVITPKAGIQEVCG